MANGGQANKSQAGLLIGQVPIKDDQEIVDSKSSAKISPEETDSKKDGEDDEDRPMTKREIYKKREEIVDKVLISAVKTLA